MALGRIVVCLALLAPALAMAQPSPSSPSASRQTNRIKVEYAPPKSPAFQPLVDILKKKHVLERLQTLLSPLLLQRDLTLKTAECGMMNAWYENDVVTVCYEYLDFVRKNAPKKISTIGVTPEDALAGQTYYVFLHETGHAMFAYFDVPVFGGEEEAADQFATYLMLQMGKDEAFPLIMGATYTFQAFLRKPEITSSIVSFSGIHGTPAQRYFNMLCIGYGARPDVFSEVVAKHYLPASRVPDCAFEYGALAWAFDHLIKPHVDQELGQKVLDRSWLPAVSSRPVRPGHPPAQ